MKLENSYRSLPQALFADVNTTPVAAPKLVLFNRNLAAELGLAAISDAQALAIFSGNQLISGSQPLAQAYAGHQFGHPTILGDGRAVLLGERVIATAQRVDIQLKGAGRTPFSRGGDGRAALAPMLREYVISEALHALAVPTTRTLAVVTTGENIQRETLLPGAIATRVATSHIRVGTFQFAAWHEDKSLLPALFDYTAKRHYPEVLQAQNPALAFLHAVMQAQLQLVVQWLRVGFVHGVLNTDNVTISGQAIDFGPCAFLEAYDANAVFSSIDRQGRYAFGQQPAITQWNLSRLAEALLPLIHPEQKTAIKLATDTLAGFASDFSQQWQQMMRAKLGLIGDEREDAQLIQDWLDLLQRFQLDYTNAHRQLHRFELPPEAAWQTPELRAWYARWRQRLGTQPAQALALMQQHNPMIIPRNHILEQAFMQAQSCGEIQPVKELLAALAKPYLERPLSDKWCQPATAQERVLQTFCGT